jgi:hypothetical protein
MSRVAIVFLGLLGAASAGQFVKKESRELTVAEQLAQLRKENADMRASLETYRLAVENVSLCVCFCFGVTVFRRGREGTWE